MNSPPRQPRSSRPPSAGDSGAVRATAAPRARPQRRLARPIVLVGLMGVGKSTIGRRLAQRLRTRFVDADDEIVRAAGMSIPEIFERYGEAYFREGERRVIRRILSGETMVLATGGGAFMNDETRALILEKGLAVWLDADLDVLAARVSRRNTRPLLRGKDPHAVLAELAEVRNPVYALAPIRVNSSDAPHETTVRTIIRAIPEWR